MSTPRTTSTAPSGNSIAFTPSFTGRSAGCAFPTWVLIGVALVLAVLETPVNKFLFDVAIRSSNVGSWLVSFGFALLLLLLAHFAGVSLRHIWSDHRKKLVIGSLLIFVLLTFVLLVLVSILTVARAAFSADTGSLQDMSSSVRSAVASLGLWGTLFNAFGDISALVLATINIGGIFVTMMLAFFTHDSDKDFDAAARAVDRSRSKLKKLTATYITGKDKIIKEFAPNISGIGADYKSANQHVIELKMRLGTSARRRGRSPDHRYPRPARRGQPLRRRHRHQDRRRPRRRDAARRAFAAGSATARAEDRSPTTAA